MTDKQLSALKACPLFQNLEALEIENTIGNSFKIITIEKNTHLNSDSVFCNALSIIIKGTASVFKLTDGKKLFMSMLSESSVFGMASMFSNDESFPTEIIALTKCEVMVIPFESFKGIIESNSIIALNYIKILSSKVHYLNKKLDLYTSSTVNSKFASFLINNLSSDGKTVIINGSLSKTAETLNTGRASLYRAIAHFESKQAIKREGKNFILLDINKLFLQE